MIRVKSVSKDGTYYLVNGWYKHKAFWYDNKDDNRVMFKDTRSAKTSWTKLLKIMPDFADDEITFEEVK